MFFTGNFNTWKIGKSKGQRIKLAIVEWNDGFSIPFVDVCWTKRKKDTHVSLDIQPYLLRLGVLGLLGSKCLDVWGMYRLGWRMACLNPAKSQWIRGSAIHKMQSGAVFLAEPNVNRYIVYLCT